MENNKGDQTVSSKQMHASGKAKRGGAAGWRALLGCTYESLALFRICLGVLLTLELILRFRFIVPFYSEEGTAPTRLLLPKVDGIYKALCLHCHITEIPHTQALLALQVILAVIYTIGYQARLASILSWYLYFSLTLRNTWLNYILDRYFHYLLFFSMFLPIDRRWTSNNQSKAELVVSPATIALKALVVWIYFDAGYGKYTDPLGGWSYNANPLPALDTYARHTLVARYMYALIGPSGLRLLTPVVVWVELLAAPVALIGSYVGSKSLIYSAVGLICALHVGIALTLRNAALLSFVACTPWCIFLPAGTLKSQASFSHSNKTKKTHNVHGLLISALFIGTLAAGNVWFEVFSQSCDQSVKSVWSTLLHNRWNVFLGAEEYVTWEIAPGLLADGSIVDVWGRRDEVSWKLPGGGAPCTATARPGRWRSFPYLAELDGDDAVALWGFLCREWDREHNVDENPSRKLIRYNFFMLQADVLPNMTFSATRKRLIKSYECDPNADIFDSMQDKVIHEKASQQADDTMNEL